MKKTVLLVAVLLMPLIFMFGRETYAAENQNLLLNKLFTSTTGRLSASAAARMTDGDLTTVAWWTGPEGYDVAYYEFENPTNITNGSVKGSTASFETIINLKDASGAVVYTTKVLNNTVAIPAVNRVKRVEIQGRYLNAYGGSSINEISLYGLLTVNPEPEKFVIKDLKFNPNVNDSGSLAWAAVVSDYLKEYRIYSGGKLIASTKSSSYAISGLQPGNSYDWTVTVVDSFDKEFPGSTVKYTIPIPDVTPPAVPTNVKVAPDQYTASVTWDPVQDSDLLGYFVYLDGERANTTPVYTNSFKLSGLKAFTDYKVQIAAVDQAWNVSERSAAVEFKTLELDSPPDTPTGLQVVSFDGSVSLSWMPSKRAQSYKIYQDDDFLVKTDATSLKIRNLENGKAYSYQVSAVNELGESDKSNRVTATPDKSLLPDVALGYSLKDVSTGASHWFASFWYILAFAIAIPLAFWISREIKGLFGGAK